MNIKNFLFSTLTAFLAIYGINGQVVAGLDYNSDQAGPSGTPSTAPYTGELLLMGTNATPITSVVTPLTFSLTGTQPIQSRDRGVQTLEPANVLRDFAFMGDGQADGSSVFTLTISGLTAGQEYTINTFHWEGATNFPARMSVELQEDGIAIAGGAQIIDTNPDSLGPVDNQTTSTFTFNAQAGVTYTIVSTALLNTVEPSGGNPVLQSRNRLNGILVEESNLLSIEDFSSNLEDSKNLTVFPNPTTGFVQIKFESKNSVSKAVLYNSLGQAVKTFLTTSDLAKGISLDRYSRGLHFLVLYSDNDVAIASKKIVIK